MRRDLFFTDVLVLQMYVWHFYISPAASASCLNCECGLFNNSSGGPSSTILPLSITSILEINK